jgi:lysophospholipase L1-like esterase
MDGMRAQETLTAPSPEPRAVRGLSRRRVGAGSLAALAALVVAGTGNQLSAASAAASAANLPTLPEGTPASRGGRTSASLVVFGDSITVGGTGWLVSASAPTTSWLGQLSERCSASFVYAKSGATAELLAAAPEPSDAADLAVFAFGTNDLHRGRTVAQMCADIERYLAAHLLASLRGATAVVTVGPRTDASRTRVEGWNRELRAAASARGWTVLDPWSGLRGSEPAAWADAVLTKDGLHPSEVGARLLGAGYEREIAWHLAGATPAAE